VYIYKHNEPVTAKTYIIMYNNIFCSKRIIMQHILSPVPATEKMKCQY